MSKKKKRSRESANQRSPLMDGLRSVLPGSTSGQIVVGIIVGGAAAYVMTDRKLREKLIRKGVQTVNHIADYVAELREEISDVQAEQADK